MQSKNPSFKSRLIKKVEKVKGAQYSRPEKSPSGDYDYMDRGVVGD